MLESIQPYPGDPSNVLQYRGRKFHSYEIAGGNLCLWDLVWDQEVIVPIEVVNQGGFATGLWYALDCSKHRGLPIIRLSWYKTTMPKNVWAWNAAKVLKLRAPYLNYEAEHNGLKQFDLAQHKGGKWIILDCLLGITTRI